MKSAALFAVFILSAVNLSLQFAELRNCPPDFALRVSIADRCSVITCDGPDSFGELGCALWWCPEGKQIGYKEVNNSRIYPDCCDGPICAD